MEEGLEPVYPNLLTTVHPDDLERIKESTVLHHKDGRVESVGVAQDARNVLPRTHWTGFDPNSPT